MRHLRAGGVTNAATTDEPSQKRAEQLRKIGLKTRLLSHRFDADVDTWIAALERGVELSKKKHYGG